MNINSDLRSDVDEEQSDVEDNVNLWASDFDSAQIELKLVTGTPPPPK